MVKRLDVSYTKLGTWFFCYRLWPANIYRSYFSKAILLMYFILVCTCLCFLIKFFMLFIKKKRGSSSADTWHQSWTQRSDMHAFQAHLRDSWASPSGWRMTLLPSILLLLVFSFPLLVASLLLNQLGPNVMSLN